MEITILLSLMLLLASLLFILLKPSTPKNLPPGPKPWPIFGNLFQLGLKPHAKLAEMARDHGPLISLTVGSMPMVVASNSTSAREVLKIHDRKLSGRFIPSGMYTKGFTEYSMVWSAEPGMYWKNARRILQVEVLAPKLVETQAHIREMKVMEMVDSLKERQGEVVRLRDVVHRTLFGVMVRLMFSSEVARDEMEYLLCRAVDLTGIAQLSGFLPMLAIVDRLSPRRKLIKKLFHIWEEVIDERRESKGRSGGVRSPHDFLSVLLDAELGDPQVKALLMDIFTAGTDTTTTTIEWAMAELIKSKPILENLRSELEREIGGETVRESHLPRLHYLDACIKETQRLHPAVPLLVHEALQTCETMDYTIPKGCHVLVNVWAMGRDPETWEDPLTFSPQRFIDSSMGYKGNDFKFIPFGEGRRSCPGVPLVNQLAPLILASLIHNFEWSMPNGMDSGHLDMDENFQLTLQKRHPLLLVPGARN